MNPAPRDARIRIFVSSPADVEHERAAVKDIVEQLGHEYLPYFELHTVLWEEEALTADRTFQAGLTQPEDCDIVLVILWTRLGSPLPEEPYRGMTGTEWEFVNAVEASARQGSPEVLVYKKTAPKLVDITDATTAREAVEDRRRLDEFFRENFFNEDNSFRRAFRLFDGDAAFRELVETQLRKLLNRRISAERRAAAGSGRWQGSPFRAGRPFDISDERVFTGREQEVRALLQRIEGRPPGSPGLLLLSGPSGSGKTSLLRAGLLPRLTRPFLFEQIATVRAALVDPHRDGHNPLAALASRLCAEDVLGAPLASFGLGAEAMERLLLHEPDLAATQLASALRQIAGESDRDARLAVVLDPLEPALLDADGLLLPLLAALRGLASHPSLWVIVALRNDALRRLAPHQDALLDRARPAAEQWLELAPPPLGRLRQVIEIPARVAGIELDGGAPGEGGGPVERIEADAAATDHWAPPTQHLLQRAFDQAEAAAGMDGQARITTEQISAQGGLPGSLLERADALWEELDEQTQAALPRLCRALINVEGDITTARRGDLETLRGDPDCRRLAQILIDARLLVTDAAHDPVLLRRCKPVDPRLTGALRLVWRQSRDEWGQWWRRLLRLDRHRRTRQDDSAEPSAPDAADPNTAATSTDVAPPDTGAEQPASGSARPPDWGAMRAVANLCHPVLLTRWRPMVDWLRQPEHRRELELRTRLSRQSRLWKRTDCNREYLYRLESYAAAREFARRHPDELEPSEREFLAASAANLKFLRRRNRFVRLVGAMLLMLLLGALFAAAIAWHASRHARVNLHQSLLKEAELHIARGNTPQAVINAIDASADLPEESVRSLSLAFNANRLLAMAPSASPSPDAPRLPGFSASGSILASITPNDGPVRWRLDGGRFLPDLDLGAEGLGVHSLVFGDEDQMFGIGTDGVWRLPAADDARPLSACGTTAGSPIEVSPDRRRLAIALDGQDGDHGLCVLDLTLPGKPILRETLAGGELRGLGFSPDGRLLATASSEGQSQVFDLDAGQQLLSLPPDGPVGRPFNNVAFDDAGERIGIASADERVRLFGVDGAPLGEFSKSRIGGNELKIHRSAVRDLDFAPSGDFLVAVDDEGQVVRWSLDGSNQAVVLGSHDLSVGDVEIAPHPAQHLGGQHLVLTGSLDHTARLWSLETGRPIAVLGHDAAVASVRFNTEGSRLSSYSVRDGTVRLWSVQAVRRLGFQLDHPDHVWDLDMAAAPKPLAPNGDALLLGTAGFDGGVRVWRYERSRERPEPELLHPLEPHDARVRQVRFAPGGRLLASAAYDGSALVHDLVTQQTCRLSVTRAPDGQVYNALFGPRADWLLTTSNDASEPVRLFSPKDCASLPGTPSLPHGEAPVQAAALQPLGDTLLAATGDDAGIVRLFLRDAAGEWHPGCELPAEVGAVGAVSLSVDGRLAAVAGTGDEATVLKIAPQTGGCALHGRLIGHAGRVYSATFSPERDQILTASLDKTARVWRADGQPLSVLMGHQDRIYRAEFSPDGDWLLTASRDGSIRLWRAPRESLPVGAAPIVQQEFLPLRANLGGVAAAAFSPDGHYIAGAYWENAAMLWRIWRDGGEAAPALRRRWGEDRSRLALIREAYRFRADNAIVDAEATRRAPEVP
jgi:WD40 repeat protein